MIKYSHLYFLLILFISSACHSYKTKIIEKGISAELAASRKSNIRNIKYALNFNIHEDDSQPIEGHERLTFSLVERQEVILDFNVDKGRVNNVVVNGENSEITLINEHILVSNKNLVRGENVIEIDFIAGEKSLNRRSDYLYTLFVPDRASTCFPVFDQPDLKAKYQLTLEVPAEWKAVANGGLKHKEVVDGRATYAFNESAPISSYLFAFSAGKFDVVSRNINGYTVNMYHRETDSVRLNNNIDEVFRWHEKSIKWLEAYSGIKYPFEKFDFVLIPSFQYGGMEHPGCVLYKAQGILLDESSTLQQQLGRAEVIAHETAHMWFGDLVTMKWFDDVWLKEVFANFMASKIVDPEYPEINHDLQFLMSHFPAAYAIDRTDGTHPIQQNLHNLKNAGTLYGSIIYHKAPIAMRMLEEAVGDSTFQNGLRKYLTTYSFDNASWDDLINILSDDVSFDIKKWNQQWVKGKGMPTVKYSQNNSSILINTYEKEGIAKSWPQKYQVLVQTGANDTLVAINGLDTLKPVNITLKENANVYLNARGRSYGYFDADSVLLVEQLNGIDSLLPAEFRGATWLNLYEAMLRGKIAPVQLLKKCVNSLSSEKENLIVNYIADITVSVFWHFISDDKRIKIAPMLEGVLLNMVLNTSDERLKATYFNALVNVSITNGSLNILEKLWAQDMEVEGLHLAERDYTRLALELALRNIPNADTILTQQLQQITNPDRKAKFQFVLPAVSSQQQVRDDFFASLLMEANRVNEDWVLDGLYYLHHPLRAKSSVKYLEQSLNILPEIQLTGDIFFPKGWVGRSLHGHTSEEAAAIVQNYLDSNTTLQANLRNKILQSSDILFRASVLKKD